MERSGARRLERKADRDSVSRRAERNDGAAKSRDLGESAPRRRAPRRARDEAFRNRDSFAARNADRVSSASTKRSRRGVARRRLGRLRKPCARPRLRARRTGRARRSKRSKRSKRAGRASRAERRGAERLRFASVCASGDPRRTRTLASVRTRNVGRDPAR